jgi:hypothetical protein
MIPRLLERYRAGEGNPSSALAKDPEQVRKALRAMMGDIKPEPGQEGYLSPVIRVLRRRYGRRR